MIYVIIGTASDVSPAADLIRYVKASDLILIEINETPTRITDIVDHFLQMSASDALKKIIKQTNREIQ
jgi:NAD-dependent SIR2 family protein deacetylase